MSRSTPALMAKVAIGLAVLARCVVAHDGPVVVSGATGRTGALTYNLLKARGVPVRGLIRNASKARGLLDCTKCDESEGIFEGDLSKPESLVASMQGAGALVILTSASPICDPYPKCHFPKGAEPVDVDWVGAKNQLEVFAKATASTGLGQVVLISTMGTTQPANEPDAFDHISFYKLNFEAHLMSSGLPFTIIKPCGLVNADPAKKEIVTGHDDELKLEPPTISRSDVARVTVASLQHSDVASGLRFDLCSKDGTPTPDDHLTDVLQSAKYPWQQEADLVI